jgi:RsiW-degrading membrane proteinase PrsW (M82 family)
MVAAATGLLLSTFTLLVPSLLETGEFGGAETPAFALEGGNFSISAADSPAQLNFTLRTPPLREGDLLYLDIYQSGRPLGTADCLADSETDYAGATSLVCTALIPYTYTDYGEYDVVASLVAGEYEYSSGPSSVRVSWSGYEPAFWSAAGILLMAVLAAYAVLVVPVFLFVGWTAAKMKHENAEPGAYSLSSLVLLNGRTLLQKFQSFLVSPYFWAFEFVGVLVIVAYLVLNGEIWKSGTAFTAFVLSGLISFIVPFLWCCAWWYADYREREPLRIMVTFFLWGMLSALLAIGVNTVFGVALAVLGVGFLSSFFIAPPVEEFYKGSGLALLAEHGEYNSIEDGILFGFTIGMGFSFIENWIYLLDNPMGSSIGGWLAVFFLRCIVFAANHAFFTALTGAMIAWLIERKFAAPALGLLAGVPVAAFFHAMHNSGETMSALLGGAGLMLYCCFLIPMFDYGGLIVVAALFARSLLRQKAAGPKTG